MKKRAILFIIGLIFCIAGCGTGKEIVSPKSADISSSIAISENQVPIICYDLPELCMDEYGNFIEIEDIRWYLWVAAEEPMEISSMPQDTEVLHDILSKSIFQVIQVPKELLPLYAIYLHVTKNIEYYGEDEDYYYYYGYITGKIWAASPDKGYAYDNYEVIGIKRSVNTEQFIGRENCLNSISKNIIEYPSIPRYITTSEPHFLYLKEFAFDFEDAYEYTIKDEEWVKNVQWAKKELMTNPEKYQYSETALEMSVKKGKLHDELQNKWNTELREYWESEGECVLSDTEEEQVIDARAQLYATLRHNDRDVALEDIMVLLGEITDKEKVTIQFTWQCIEGVWTLVSGKSFCPYYYQDITHAVESLEQIESNMSFRKE